MRLRKINRQGKLDSKGKNLIKKAAFWVFAFVLFFGTIAGIITPAKISLFPPYIFSQRAEAAGWLSPWLYKNPIDLAPATPMADYQVQVQLTSSNFDYSKLSFPATGDDLRFTGPDGTSLLYYWIGSWNNGGTSIIWVRVPAAGTSRIYLYYGNSGATPMSSGGNTFDFFDDFSGATLNPAKWTTHCPSAPTHVCDASYTLSSGKLKVYTGTSSLAEYHIEQATAIPVPAGFDMMVDITGYSPIGTNSGNYNHFGITGVPEQTGGAANTVGGDSMAIEAYNTGNNFFIFNGNGAGADYSQSIPWPSPTQFRLTKLGDVFTYYVNTGAGWIQQGQTTASGWTAAYPNMKFMLRTTNHITPTFSQYMEYANIRVRKYASPEIIATFAYPSCTLTADPVSVFSGDTSVLTWTTSNATSATINGVAVDPETIASGSKSTPPITATTTFSMNVSGAIGSASCGPITITMLTPPLGGLVPCGRLADNPATGDIDESKPCSICAMFYMLKNAINFIITLAVGIGVFILVIAGLTYALSGGNPMRIEQAKAAVSSVIIGIALIYIAWLVIAVILQGMGYANMGTWNQVNCSL